MKAIQDELPAAVARLGPRTDYDLMRTSLHQPEVFAEIFERHAAAIHRYLSRRVGDLADDLLSETFLTAFRKRGDYRADRVDVRPWLYGIGANLIRRHQRALSLSGTWAERSGGWLILVRDEATARYARRQVLHDHCGVCAVGSGDGVDLT